MARISGIGTGIASTGRAVADTGRTVAQAQSAARVAAQNSVNGAHPQPTDLITTVAQDGQYQRLYKRSAKLTLFRDGTAFDKETPTGLEVTDLRFKFEVQHSLTSNPNTADVWVHNMTDAHRAAMQIKPLSVQLEAGYDGVNRLLAVGDVHFAMSEMQHTDWVTLLQMNDLGRAFAYGRVSLSYGASVPIRKILSDVAATMGLKLPTNLAKDTSLDTKYASGYVAHGQSQLELTRLLAPFGYHWSVQNGLLQVLRDEQVRDGEAIPIDEAHGMIGTPNFGAPPRGGKDPHVTVKSLLYPELVPGALVQITSRAFPGGKGNFRVQKTKTIGDTHAGSGTWTTECEVLPI